MLKKISLLILTSVVFLELSAQNYELVGNLVDVGYYSSPFFIDYDNDNDLDFICGNNEGKLFYFEKVDERFIHRTGMDNPFEYIDSHATKPVFVDFDGDNDLDLINGDGSGGITYHINNGGVFSEVPPSSSPFGNIKVPEYSCPALSDVDGDGDIDLLCGVLFEGVWEFYENVNGTFVKKTGSENPFQGLDKVDTTYNPIFVDFDGDSDEDLVAGSNLGQLYYYENNQGVFTEKKGAENPFDGLITPRSTDPFFMDFDGDNDLDLITGSFNGKVWYFRNISDALSLNKNHNNTSQFIFPNPASEFLNVQKNGIYQVLNLSGEVVLQKHVLNNVLDISSLKGGQQYILKSEDGASMFIKE